MGENEGDLVEVDVGVGLVWGLTMWGNGVWELGIGVGKGLEKGNLEGLRGLFFESVSELTTHWI